MYEQHSMYTSTYTYKAFHMNYVNGGCRSMNTHTHKQHFTSILCTNYEGCAHPHTNLTYKPGNAKYFKSTQTSFITGSQE